MEISKRTIDALKNFHSINQSLYYNPDTNKKQLTTKSIQSNIIAGVDIDEEFPVEFAIFNLSEFLGALNLFDKPDLEFSEKYVIVRECGSRRGGLKYFFANPHLIAYPKKPPVEPEANIKFYLSAEQLNKLTKAASSLSVNDLLVFGDDEGVHLIVKDKNNSTSNGYEVTVSSESQGDFEHYFKVENWKFLPGNYNVGITIREGANGTQGLGFFTSEDGSVKYGVAVEKI